MQYQKEQENKPIKQNKKIDAEELNRLLKTYQGIFKNNIKHFAERNAIQNPKVKNYSR